MLSPDEERRWLEADPAAALDLLDPYPDDELHAYPDGRQRRLERLAGPPRERLTARRPVSHPRPRGFEVGRPGRTGFRTKGGERGSESTPQGRFRDLVV